MKQITFELINHRRSLDGGFSDREDNNLATCAIVLQGRFLYSGDLPGMQRELLSEPGQFPAPSQSHSRPREVGHCPQKLVLAAAGPSRSPASAQWHCCSL